MSGESGARSGVTAAQGYRASAVYCGIRKKQADDLALVVSDTPASAAAVFTRNLVKAAPLIVSAAHLEAAHGRARAVVANAGNANACTGEAGLAAARSTAEATAGLLGVPTQEVLVASTGVIGVPMPAEKLAAGLPRAVAALSPSGGASAARAIMTTDLAQKESVRTVRTPQGAYVVGGMAKGSGMIHPDMATMLAFVTTDARIEPDVLLTCLRRATDVSFNRLTVDGDTSTNDMAVLLANGASGVSVAAGSTAAFEEALTAVLVDLARAIARDGEGATKLITVTVTGARNEADALAVARTVAGSPLVKTAIHGADANWGRIIAAAGRSGVALDPATVSIRLGDVEVLSPGCLSAFSEALAREVLLRDEVVVGVDLGSGRGEATVWTCDLAPGYITINASYRT